MKYRKGNVVEFLSYGVKQTGTVERDQASQIVFVRKRGNGRLAWLHEESLTLIDGSSQ